MRYALTSDTCRDSTLRCGFLRVREPFDHEEGVRLRLQSCVSGAAFDGISPCREAGNAGGGTGGQDDLSASVAAMPVLLVLIRRGEVKPAQEWLFERP
jgi:hypothetical protein